VKRYEMLIQPSRGGLKEGVSFGYVDVPQNMTDADRPFLDHLTDESLKLQQRIRKGKEIVVKTHDTTYLSNGKQKKIRIFIPDANEPCPVILYYHGGGFAIRDIECYDYIGRYIAAKSKAVVFMPEYSLSPENKFPTAVEECYDALLWARENAGRYNGDADNDIVIGDSAGGNAAIVVSMMCRDRGVRIPKKMIPVYPVVDQTGLIDRESQHIYGKNYNLDYAHMISYSKAYVRSDTDLSHKYCSPLFAESVAGLPSCMMIMAECDILIDQGLEFAKRLVDAGIEFDYRVFKGMPHDFLFYGFDESYEAYDLICDAIKKLYHK